MKAVVAVPPIRDFYHTPHRFSSLGAIAVKKILEECGVDAVLMNFPAMTNKPIPTNLPPELLYLTPYLIQGERGRTSFFQTFNHFGPDIETCTDIIMQERPDLCFLSCFAYCYSPQLIELAQCIRDRSATLPIIAGGAGVSVACEEIMQCLALDAAIIREAENAIPLYIQALRNKSAFHHVPNVVWRENSRILFSDISDTPETFPLIWSETSVKNGRHLISTALTRGCPRACRYCPIHLVHGKRLRKTAEQQLTEAIESESFSPDLSLHVIFEDDNLLLDFEYVMRIVQICNAYFKDFSFSAENGMDYLLLDEDKIQRLVESGITQFNLSIMSTTGAVLDGQSRHHNIDHYKKVVSRVSAHRLPCITYFICGCNGDSVQSIADNIVFLSEQPTSVGISMFYAVPGLADMTDKQIRSPYHCLGSVAYPWFTETSILVTAFRLSRLINLIKTDNKSPQEIQLIRKCLKEKQLYTFIRKDKQDVMIAVEHMNLELSENVLSRIQPENII